MWVRICMENNENLRWLAANFHTPSKSFMAPWKWLQIIRIGYNWLQMSKAAFGPFWLTSPLWPAFHIFGRFFLLGRFMPLLATPDIFFTNLFAILPVCHDPHRRPNFGNLPLPPASRPDPPPSLEEIGCLGEHLLVGDKHQWLLDRWGRYKPWFTCPLIRPSKKTKQSPQKG